MTIDVTEALPEGVRTAPDGLAFLLDLDPITVRQTLGELCGSPCRSVDGLTVPKPEVNGSMTQEIALPEDVTRAAIRGGVVELRLTNGFTFDPLRPGGGARGAIVISARSGDALLLHDSITGTSTSFAPGSTLRRTLALSPGEAEGDIALEVTFRSPAGDRVQIRSSDQISAVADVHDVVVVEAEVAIAGKELSGDSLEVELAGVDPALLDRLEAGSIVLESVNPWDVAGEVELDLRAGTTEVFERLLVPAGGGESAAELEREDLRAVLEAGRVSLTYGGHLAADAPPVVVRPGQTLELVLSLRLRTGPLW